MRNLKKITFVIIIVTYFLIGTSFAQSGNVNAQAARLRKEANTSSNIITNIYKGEEVEILEESGDWYKVKYQNNTGYVKKEFVTEKITNTNNQNNTNTASSNTVSEQNNTAQNTSTKNTATNTNNQNVANVQNTSVQNTNTQNVADENNAQVSNNQSNENGDIISVSTSVNLRIVPNLMSNKITEIEAGKQLTKVLEVKNWVQVTDGNITGWLPKAKISTSAVTQESNESTPETPAETNTSNTSAVNNTTNTASTNTANLVSTNIANEVDNNSTNNVVNNTTASNNQSQTNSNKTGKVNVETAKVREKANQSSKFISLLDYGDTVTITGEEGDWYKITAGSTSGYIKKTLVTVSNVSSRSSSEERTPIDNKEEMKVDQEVNNAVSSMLSSETAKVTKGEDVANYAKNYLGTSYVVGGKTPESGFDCSGFTRYVFANFGYNLGTTAANQNNIGTDVSKEDLKAGDLILFYDEGKNKIGHTGIYISNGEFVHAANPQRGVVTDNLNTSTYYNERFIVAKRIVD